MTSTEFIKLVTHAYPEYKGRLLFGIGELATMYTRGNTHKMRAHLNQYRVPYYCIEDGHKLYNLLEVQESIEETRWKQ